jgi:hypothetical protein
VTSEEFGIATLFLQDKQRLIAAGKIQRWEIVKWVLAANLAFAAGSATTQLGRWSLLLVFFSAFISALAIFLLFHYNSRMTGSRNDAKTIIDFLQSNGLDIKRITGDDFDYSAGHDYDRPELFAHSYAIVGSIIPIFAIWEVRSL